MKQYIFLLIWILLLSCSRNKRTMTQHQNITNWTFCNAKDSVFQPSIARNVHLDLLNQKSIDDPFYSNNELKYKWIENEDWIYQAKFQVKDEYLNYKKVILNFDGLDTYAEIYLNGQKLGVSQNMFVPFTKDISSLVLPENELTVKFYSATRTAEPLYDAHCIKLPADNDRNEKATSVYTRKAPYQYGWDWGPRLVGVAIWKPVYLEFWDDIEIKADRVFQQKLEKDKAELGVKIELESHIKQKLKIELFKNNKLFKTQYFPIEPGINSLVKTFEIENPKLWWPNGYGEAYLYDFRLKISGKDLEWEKNYKIGFRNIKLERQKDSIGESFQFVVNGIPIYAKGANYIPQDIFPDRVSEEEDKKMIQLSLDAHMNMLRIWGGGVYESDSFYELCDEKGIMLWQDFIFACSLYPGDSAFIQNVKEEAGYQIKRLRDHPSLALWCGNNEINELWHNWGYQRAYSYSTEDSITIWNDYQKLFTQLLPQLVHQFDPKTSYLESSPVYGWGHEKSMTHGDSHYWGIWWGKQPFEMYEEKVPRFSSEFGFQSIPHLNTVLSFTDSSQLDLFSEDMKAHQKSSIGNQTILDYLPKYYPQPRNFEEIIYISQLLQAYGMDLAFRAQRLSKPRCMGTLYWQLNDCWPALSWSSTDYYKQKKATHYVAEEDFATFMLKSEIKENKLTTQIVSDSLQEITAKLHVSVLSFTGDTLKRFEQDVAIKANQVTSLDLGRMMMRSFNPSQAFIYSKLILDDETLADRVDFFGKPKDLQFPQSDIKIEQIEENTFKISSSTSVFNYKVYLSTQEFGNFEPNFFHLLPGEEKVVRFIPNDKEVHLDTKDIKSISLNQI